jgi:hypothetical protein
VSAGLQNPLLAATLQNPLLAATLQNPLLTQTLGYGSGLQQQPQYGGFQQQPQFSYPLAPQSLIGGGIGQQFGHINPLAQLALRQATSYGISPLAGCF